MLNVKCSIPLKEISVNGLILIDKPKGWTSHDVVAKIRGILATEIRNRESSSAKASEGLRPPKRPRVGHTGTLDPMATGLLILVLGSYTKRAGEFSKLDKTYEAEITLGATSTTGDKEGEITAYSTQLTADSKRPTEKRIREVLGSFKGQIEQTPHAYSAVKIGGQRAYKLARQGKKPRLEPRQVTVYSLQLTDYKYPLLQITTSVSSGTYIRSLAEDIGEKLHTGAYLSALRRTEVGQFKVVEALSLDKITPGVIAQHLTTRLAKTP